MPQARKSSIHFAPVTNIKFAVSHSERTELSEPGYLLPKEHQLPNILVDGSLSENELAELFIKQKECMTGQAKARGSSPFWEGVVVLKNTDGEEQSKKLQAWKVAYENATGHKVLHMTIHLDEGYLDKDGKPHYNPHAHVIVSRMNEKNRVIQLKRKQLGEVQDLTAEILQMDRGSTLKERGGKRGRVHIGHKEFRIMANEARLDLEKGNNQKDFYVNLLDYKNQQDHINREKIKEANKVIAEKDAEIARLKLEHKAEFEQLKTEYATDRAELKASGEATQRDYQNLKKDHEAKVAELQEAHAEKVSELENKIQAEEEEKTKTLDGKNAEIARLKSEYAEEREALKASGTAKQSDYQQLKKDHEKAVAELAEARQEAARVPVLVDQVRAIEAQAATARQGRDEATAKAEQALVDAKGKDATQARQVTTLQADLLEARQQAAKAEQALVDAKGKDATQARQVTTLQADLLEARQQAAKAEQALVDAKGKDATQARQVTTLQADLLEARQQAAKAEQALVDAKGKDATQARQVTTLQADLLEARQQAAKAEQALVDAKGKDATQARQVTTLQADLLEARQQAAKAEQALVDAKGKDATQARQVTTLQADLLEARQQAAKAEQALVDAKGKDATQARQVTTLQADLLEARQQAAKAEQALVDAKGKDATQARQVTTLQAELGKVQAQATEAQQAQAQAARELAKAQADLAAAQQAHGVALAGKDAELGKERAKVAQAAQALAQAATEKTGFEQVIERLKATIEKLTKRIIGLDDKVTEMTAAAERDADKRALQEQRAMQVASPPSATQDRSSKAAAPQEEVRARLVEKYKSVAHGVAEGELSHASLGTATLVETQGGLAVYRVRGEHYIQQQPEQQKQGIQAKSGLGR